MSIFHRQDRFPPGTTLLCMHAFLGYNSLQASVCDVFCICTCWFCHYLKEFFTCNSCIFGGAICSLWNEKNGRGKLASLLYVDNLGLKWDIKMVWSLSDGMSLCLLSSLLRVGPSSPLPYFILPSFFTPFSVQFTMFFSSVIFVSLCLHTQPGKHEYFSCEKRNLVELTLSNSW